MKNLINFGYETDENINQKLSIALTAFSTGSFVKLGGLQTGVDCASSDQHTAAPSNIVIQIHKRY